MSWVLVGQTVNIALGLILIIRLLRLRLQRVYSVFCVFLLCEFAHSLLAYAKTIAPDSLPDYRIIWMCGRAVIWVFTLWTVYALLDAVLQNLPGVLRLSRRLLNSVFIAALIFGMLTVRPEYSVSGLSGQIDPVKQALGITVVLDRVVCTIALFALVCILGFLLWFPVQISRNLIVFTTGFLVYFAAKAGLLLTRSVWSHESLALVSNLIMFTSAACFAYWALFITPEAEGVPVRIGHSWHRREQERLIGQLEAINLALLRAAPPR